MKIVGADLSTKCSGLALIEDGQLKKHYAIDFSKEKDSDVRSEKMIRKIDAVLKEWDAHVVFVETPWMGNNMQTTLKLAYLIGSVRHICMETGAGFNLIQPSEWRKVIGIKSGKKKRPELKQEAMNYISEKYKLAVSEDEAEAICIADASYTLTDGGAIFL